MCIDTVLFVSQGINSLIARRVYDSAFPLHDVSITEIATRETKCHDISKKGVMNYLMRLFSMFAVQHSA